MSLIQLVNDQVSIAQACRWAEVDVRDGFDNRKTYCPFGITHPDGGKERALRLYVDTNSAYCFACARAWTPVKLMAEYWDCTWAEAAAKMGELSGVKETTWRDEWAEMHQPQVPDRNALAEALKTWCRRMYGPAWTADQLDDRFARPLNDCLSYLPLVTTAEEASVWLDGCKVVMGQILERRNG